jgi:uncharacterized protein YkwD
LKWSTGIAVLFFLALVAVIRNPGIIDTIYEVSGLEEEHVLVPDPAFAGVTASSTPEGVAPTPRSVPKSELTIDDLKILALSYINEDRAKHGLPPVTLDGNGAAQSHADDMLAGRYLGHWWIDGSKPYMVYSELDGDSYVSENAARSGFSVDEYSEYCSGKLVRCEQVDAVDDIKRLQYLMMYDDASSDWGHRDNILNPEHRKVSIGVAYTSHFLAFVQHFEGGAVTSVQAPEIDAGGTLTLTAQINEPGFELFGAVTVHREELPTPKTPQQIEELHSYCVGGDFSEDCGQPIARVLPPPPRGRRYVGLPGNAIVADTWQVSDGIIAIRADLGSLGAAPGVYTITLYRDDGTESSGASVLQLSVTVMDGKRVAEMAAAAAS